jgi:hypothetical protein
MRLYKSFDVVRPLAQQGTLQIGRVAVRITGGHTTDWKSTVSPFMASTLDH